jgi:hypothetical protein
METGNMAKAAMPAPARLDEIAKSGASETAKAKDMNAAVGSAGSDALKSLVGELTKDGKIDKADLNILKLFLDLLKSMNADKGDDSLEKGKGDAEGGMSLAAAPGAGGSGGSQAPPAASGAGGAPAADAAKGSGAPDEAGDGGKADDAGEAGEAGEASDANPKLAAASKGQTDGAEGKTAAKPGKADAEKPSVDGGGDKARQTFNDLKESANADGKVSGNEKKALDMFADKFGVKDKGKNDMSNVLKSVLESSLKDGKIDDNEAKAIEKVIDSMGGKSSLGKGEIQEMLSKFMKGAEADNNFSDQDLSTFSKLLSLADGSDASGGSSKTGGVGSSGQRSAAAPGWQNMQSLLSSYLDKSAASDLFSLPGMQGKDDDRKNGGLL